MAEKQIPEMGATFCFFEPNDPVLIALIHAAVSILMHEDRGNLRDEKVAASRLLCAKFKEFTPSTDPKND